jgi:hypothetical protein
MINKKQTNISVTAHYFTDSAVAKKIMYTSLPL